jgi:hypothetical protein
MNRRIGAITLEPHRPRLRQPHPAPRTVLSDAADLNPSTDEPAVLSREFGSGQRRRGEQRRPDSVRPNLGRGSQ